MSMTIRIPGKPTSREEATKQVRGGPPLEGATEAGTRLLDSVEVVGAFDLTPAARSQTTGESTVEAEETDLLEFELEDGFTIWTSVAEYRDRLGALKPGTRGAKEIKVEALPRFSASDRGVKDWMAEKLRVLRLKPDHIWEDAKDPKTWPDWLKEFGIKHFSELGSWLSTKLIIWLIEKKLDPGEGLYRWADLAARWSSSSAKAPNPLSLEDFQEDTPVLVFVHGTASNTRGSFGAFGTHEAEADWQALKLFFKEQIYAFEHRTMSQSPIENALALAKALPKRARLYLVSHSRGGQVADLLCLRDVASERLESYRRADGDLARADHHDRTQLKKLIAVLRDKQFDVKRLLRVASPSRGTLLASENLDQFLSILANLIGFIPAVGQSPVYQVIKRITLEVAKNRMKPELVPGIEAMVPTSPLVGLLNDPGTTAKGELGVVAGDIEGGRLLKRIGVFITDTFLYEGRDNDLVVNTESMFQGAIRPEGARYVFDQGADVSHFQYFRNARTRRVLAQCVTGQQGQWPPEFQALEAAKIEPVPMLRSIQTRSGEAQPVVFVLPGIMGSHLERDGNRVWLDYLSLIKGGLAEIRSITDPAIVPTGLVGRYYRGLCEYLSDSHEVIPFAYDWRKSIREAANMLALEVQKTFDRTKQPIRFVAHSMGGLVVRRMIADHAALWDQICKEDGARLVMLGTPNRGSYSMVESLLGVAKTVQQLALLDLRHGTNEIVQMIEGFQGALELLPQGEVQYFAEAKWKQLKKAQGLDGAPSSALLSQAKAVLDGLPGAMAHADRVVYVAGRAPATISGVKFDNGRVEFEATVEGDGRVTYESGRLPNVPMWFVDAEHGDLPDYKPAFPGYRDLLERGMTTRLSATPRGLERGVAQIARYIPEKSLYPTEAEFEAGLLGRRTRVPRRHARPGLRVSVVHGNFAQASHPVMVGHYLGDTIAGAERELDQHLGGALERRYQLGRYPGQVGSAAIVIPEQTEIQSALNVRQGGIVIGLGKWGELTPSTLTAAVCHGALEFVLQTAGSSPARQNIRETMIAGNPPDGRTIGALLIGSNTSANIAVEDAVNAVLRGIVQANLKLEEQDAALPRITQVQFFELYLDVAIEAAKATKKVQSSIVRESNLDVMVEPLLQTGTGGRHRTLPRSGRDYWRRWTITAEHESPPPPPMVLPPVLRQRLRTVLEHDPTVDTATWKAMVGLALRESSTTLPPAHRRLRYLALSDRARAEVVVQERQPELIDQLIQRAIRDTADNREVAKTMFELLIPVDLKDSLAQQARVVLVLDAETAAYPWELMIQGEQPLCVKMGLIRQLETADYVERVRATSSRDAYVLGDPLTPAEYPPLPGARKEAEVVQGLLKSRFAVTYAPERQHALQVMNALFARPYRMIHIAGHGYYDTAASRTAGGKTGVVLDDGVYLTAAEIHMLDPIPELVFLNCCYLGQIGRPTAYHKMAASISRELIRKGVRAVVAAGWPVRDDDALVFARVFYETLLRNETFGNAMKKARHAIWDPQGGSNTWGAYQAYGDPDFRLDPRSDGSGGAVEEPMVAVQELLDKLDSLTERVKKGGGREAAKKHADALRKLQKHCAPEWLEQSVVQARLAKLYGELGNVDASMTCFKQAVESDDHVTPATLQTVEQWANQEARLAEQAINLSKAERIDMVKRAIDRLEHLVAIGSTSERLSLLGSAYKRWAQIESDPTTIRQHLRQSADYYRQAVSPQQARTEFDPYPAVNWLAIQMILEEQVSDGVMWLEKCEVAAKQRYEKQQNTWDAVTLVDVALLRHVRQGTVEEKKEALVSRYREAMALVGATPKDIDSILNQLKFVIDTLDKLGKGTEEKKPKPAWLQALEYIRTNLQQDEPPPKTKKSAETPKASPTASRHAPRAKRAKVVKGAPAARKKRG